MVDFLIFIKKKTKERKKISIIIDKLSGIIDKEYYRFLTSLIPSGYAESIIGRSAMPEQVPMTQQITLPLQSSRIWQSRKIAIRLM